jgi:hypothetical protein
MFRFAVLALCAAACGRARGVQDQDLPGLVVEARKPEAPIDVDRATRDPAELGRALARPYRVVVAALGPHTAGVSSATTVDEGGHQVSELSDHAQIDNASASAFHAVYTNSADYGREAIFIDERLYLRPRYQRWHARDPESPDEPAELRDRYFEAIAATWDLLAPGAELADGGPLEVAGRHGRRIAIKRAAEPRDPPAEPIAQRKWRETRSIDAVTGEIVLDTERGVPLAVKLDGAVGFTRDGKHFAMKVSVDSTLSGIGTSAAVAPPPASEVVTTPERRREVDDRDYLLQGIAPPLRRNPDGTAIPPQPNLHGPGAGPGSDASRPAGAPPPADKAAKPARPADKSGKTGDKPASGDKPAKSTDKPDVRRAKPQDGAKP